MSRSEFRTRCNAGLRVVTALGVFLTFSAAKADNFGENNSLLSIRDLTAHGQHLEALKIFDEKEESKRSLADRLAAAKSAWALGLPDRARVIWDEALSQSDFVGSERERELLARAILELQEGRFDEARSRAESAAQTIASSPMRAQFWLVVAEALKSQGALSQAETYYRRAAEETSPDGKSEVMFLLGECQRQLGLTSEARYSYTAVESKSKYSSAALQRLTDIDLSQRNYEGVLTWVSEGRENNPQEFDDPWIGYAEISALVELDRVPDAQRMLEKLRVRHSDKDPWFLLAEAAVEARGGGRAMLAPVKPAKDIPEEEETRGLRN